MGASGIKNPSLSDYSLDTFLFLPPILPYVLEPVVADVKWRPQAVTILGVLKLKLQEIRRPIITRVSTRPFSLITVKLAIV